MPDISLYLTHDLTYSILRYHNNSFYYIYNLIHASAIKKPIMSTINYNFPFISKFAFFCRS